MKLGASGIRKLGEVLMETKRVCPLIIEMEFPYMKELGRLLTWTNRWKELELYSSSLKYESGLDILNVLSRLGDYKDLSSLNVYFGDWFKLAVQKRITECFSEQTRFLKKLKTANLDFNYFRPVLGSEICGRNILEKSPVFTFEYPNSLVSLYLSYHETTAITKELVPLLTANIPSSLKHLDLNLDLISTSIQSEEKEL